MPEPLDSSNPYAAPTVEATARESVKGTELKQVSIFNALARWTLICALSAIPSFVFGFSFTQHYLKVPAMIAGVLVFAVSYAYIDVRPRWRRWMADGLTSNCIKWTYGLRIAASIIFPVGGFNDLLVGMLSVNAVGAVFRGFSGGGAGQISNPVQIFVTTLVQGLLLNVELLLIAMLLIGISRVVVDIRERRRSTE